VPFDGIGCAARVVGTNDGSAEQACARADSGTRGSGAGCGADDCAGGGGESASISEGESGGGPAGVSAIATPLDNNRPNATKLNFRNMIRSTNAEPLGTHYL
jgi:hypothetical protein